MKMLGSAMLAWASSKEEVLEKLKKDVYTENRVWDWEKVPSFRIFPSLSLFFFARLDEFGRALPAADCRLAVPW